MAILRFVGRRMTNLSGDTKPNNAGTNGYRAIETDTGRVHYNNGSSWTNIIGHDKTETLTGKTISSLNNVIVERAQQSLFDQSAKRVGSVIGAITAANGLVGCLQGMTVNGDGTPISEFSTGENGFVQKFQRSGTGVLGYSSTSASDSVVTRRTHNPVFKCRARLDNTSNIRLYIGFTSASSMPNTDTPIGTSDHGVVWGFRTSDANFSTFNNDGSGSAVVTSMGVAKDTSHHTVTFTFSSSNVIVVMDDGAGAKTQTLTTDIPGSTTDIKLSIIGGYA
jgi:hypothetical protein